MSPLHLYNTAEACCGHRCGNLRLCFLCYFCILLCVQMHFNTSKQQQHSHLQPLAFFKPHLGGHATKVQHLQLPAALATWVAGTIQFLPLPVAPPGWIHELFIFLWLAIAASDLL